MWWERLQSVPFISSKCIYIANFIFRAERTHLAPAQGRIRARHSGEEAQKDSHPRDSSAICRDATGIINGAERRSRDGSSRTSNHGAAPKEHDQTKAQKARIGVN